MAIVHIPSLMRDLTGGAESVTVEGATIRHVIENLERQYPGIKARLCDGDHVRSNISVWLDGEMTRAGMIQAVGEKSEIHFLPSISGG